ncbi:hypothetical protein ACN47A_06835 [Myxococcus fulvus]|uniref:hypothetical protein n=1 Tax=Myxococcus fulvus TaxID=33 RepID=UPI003B9912D0
MSRTTCRFGEAGSVDLTVMRSPSGAGVVPAEATLVPVETSSPRDTAGTLARGDESGRGPTETDRGVVAMPCPSALVRSVVSEDRSWAGEGAVRATDAGNGADRAAASRSVSVMRAEVRVASLDEARGVGRRSAS